MDYHYINLGVCHVNTVRFTLPPNFSFFARFVLFNKVCLEIAW